MQGEVGRQDLPRPPPDLENYQGSLLQIFPCASPLKMPSKRKQSNHEVSATTKKSRKDSISIKPKMDGAFKTLPITLLSGFLVGDQEQKACDHS